MEKRRNNKENWDRPEGKGINGKEAFEMAQEDIGKANIHKKIRRKTTEDWTKQRRKSMGRGNLEDGERRSREQPPHFVIISKTQVHWKCAKAACIYIYKWLLLLFIFKNIIECTLNVDK